MRLYREQIKEWEKTRKAEEEIYSPIRLPSKTHKEEAPTYEVQWREKKGTQK